MVQDTKVEDMRLPPAVVSRIVDRAIGPTGSVSKEARTAIGRAASAFRVIECDHLTTPLQEALEAWKANKAYKSEETRKRKAEKKGTEKSTSGISGDGLSSSFTIAPSEEMRFIEDEEEY
ncbi:hypothetical protein NECAME_15665 [Necator americanus]|uniref:Transcription factor CBF/NF-Y/archaeal histone domain-containing protein n=1 Tax=Necator americanus TaxID=51031 RepID=W2SJ08_NECAM|nr:hypothetical protein NECAME_15665 [Necator americanus]ETN68727.1 hypothetical protein NECAME_15665 [Necator americanus]